MRDNIVSIVSISRYRFLLRRKIKNFHFNLFSFLVCVPLSVSHKICLHTQRKLVQAREKAEDTAYSLIWQVPSSNFQKHLNSAKT
uniref:Uncharacterized protein n=1 Tax=Anguilla anguilla TaxID=7936 RepID=A0A0E9XQR2_ANGAN